MNTIKIKIVDSRIRKEEIGYKSDGAAAIDIYALPTKNGYFDGYKTGIAVEIPEGYVGIIVPRSSTGIKGYTITRTANDKKALLTARIRIVPIEAVEDFDISIYLEDSLTGIVVNADETQAE